MTITVNESLYNKRNKISYGSIILNILLGIVIIIMAIQAFLGAFYRGMYIVHSSMYPTLHGARTMYEPGGDYIYINPNRKPAYGDIVVEKTMLFNEITGRYEPNNIIKRVIAFEGDTVRLEYGQLYITYSGEDVEYEIDEYYVSPECNTPLKDCNNMEAHTVAEGCVFLMGDNRNVSQDSRSVGDYPLEDLVGVVPEWSLAVKPFTTAIHTFFNFTLPQAFGIKQS